MNCAVHTESPAVAFCRTCGKALCETCKRDVMGAIYCEPCLAARLQGAPPVVATPPPMVADHSPNPAVAAVLGFIPGVGAMYNGQFVKALVHVGIFVATIVATSEASGFFGLLIPFWVIYMAFDAYHTARARQLGQPAPDLLGIDRIFGIHEASPPPVPPNPVVAQPVVAMQPVETVPGVNPVAENRHSSPVGAVVLVALGVFFLLANSGIVHVGRLWPLFLIGVGIWLAYKRTVAPERQR